jgi:hypothetical protein
VLTRNRVVREVRKIKLALSRFIERYGRKPLNYHMETEAELKSSPKQKSELRIRERVPAKLMDNIDLAVLGILICLLLMNGALMILLLVCL